MVEKLLWPFVTMQKMIQNGQTVVEVLNLEESCNLIGRELFGP